MDDPGAPPAKPRPQKLVPVTPAPKKPTQAPQRFQSKQMFQTPLTWHYPVVPKPESTPVASFVPKVPVSATSVAAQCGENLVHVEVKRDLLGIGQPIQRSHLTLGGCEAHVEDGNDEVFVFESELQECGSKLTVAEDSLIYTFTLVYEPKAVGNTPIVKTSAAVVAIECHYLRKHNVSSGALTPHWVPYSSTKVAKEQLYFSLRLMTDEWGSERPINTYFLGDVINIEASVMQYKHVPLRVFVDSCVATLEPDVNTVPRYAFIEEFGCLVDAKLTGSRSTFLPRHQDNKLQLQLEAFRFQQQTSGSIYITCHVHASTVSTLTDKACSHFNGWRSADGNDEICDCCESTCGARKVRHLAAEEGLEESSVATIGPIIIQE